MHAGTEERAGQTVGSMVSELDESASIHWVTGTAASCLSIFKPVLIGTPLPKGLIPTDRFDPQTLWWRHEQFHRAALFGNFSTTLREIGEGRDALECDFRTRVAAVLSSGEAKERAKVVVDCWSEALAMEGRWYARIAGTARPDERPYSSAWLEMDRIAGLEVRGSGARA